MQLIAWPVYAWIWYRRRPALLTEYAITVDPDAGVTMRSELGTSHTPWSGFERIIETRNLFMLSGRANQGYVSVPKSSMSTSEVDRMRSLLRARINRPLLRK